MPLENPSVPGTPPPCPGPGALAPPLAASVAGSKVLELPGKTRERQNPPLLHPGCQGGSHPGSQNCLLAAKRLTAHLLKGTTVLTGSRASEHLQ